MKEASDNVAENDVDKVKNKRTKKCRYFNRGYCKYCDKCRFIHPKNICSEYLKTSKCERKNVLTDILKDVSGKKLLEDAGEKMNATTFMLLLHRMYMKCLKHAKNINV